MGFRRRTRRRALVAGAVAGGALAHHEAKVYGEQQSADDYQEPTDDYQEPEQEAQYAPPPPDPTDELEHLAKLHESGALTDEEFTAAKAKIINE
jgi:Short C-terminal domain